MDHAKASSDAGSTPAAGNSNGSAAPQDKTSQSAAAANASGSAAANAANTAAAAGSAADAADTAAAGNPPTGKTSGAAAKGKVPARSTATKTAATQTPNATAQNADDPANAATLSILQLLARSLDGDDSAAPAATAESGDSADGAAATTKSADDSNGSSNTDPNAVALQLFTQALAAALGGATVSAQATSSGSTAAASDDSADAIGDATKSANGSSLQDLVSLLAQDAAASSKENSAAGALQAAATGDKSTPSDNGVGNATAAAANSIAHLGVASHFSLQHAQSDTNTTSGELRSQVGSAAWNDELGGQLTWMTHQGIESGSLKLSPEHLGPLEVTISVQNGDASVWFGANQADTRQALEQALPRLREMFASQGLTLTDSGVSRESPRNQSKPSSTQGVSSIAAVGNTATSGSAAVRMTLGLVDTYA
jgi:flagellar hook-length control protein FliK